MNAIVILCDTLRRDHCGPYHQGRPLSQCWSRQAPDWVVLTPTWLSDRQSDPNELVNLAEQRPDKLRQRQQLLKRTLIDLDAPVEQLRRLGLR